MPRLAAFYALTTSLAVGVILVVVLIADRSLIAFALWSALTFGVMYWAGSTLFQWVRIGKRRP